MSYPGLLILLALSVRNDPDDHKLADLIRRNDPKAFELFYKKYQKPLISYLVSKGVPTEEAEDLVQNAFLILWDKRDTIRPEQSLKSFVYTIAHNRMLNFFRDRKDHDPEYAYRLQDSGQNPSESAETAQAIQAMQKALEVMPEKRRNVFELCYLQDFSYRETAEILNITRKTVENHMIQALKDLRAALINYFPDS